MTTKPPAPAAILQVKTWIVEGQQTADIAESAAAAFPKENPVELMGAALQALADECTNLDVEVARGFVLNAYREVYRQAIEIKDFAAALSALRAFERQIPR